MYGACYPIMALSVLANKKKKPQILGWEVYIRIGDIIRALKPLFVGCFKCIKMGMLKAKVFPDPVGAEARSSRPYKQSTLSTRKST